MASPIDTRNESLQCLACSLRQYQNTPIDETDLLQVMNWCRQSNNNTISSDHRRDLDTIKDCVDIEDQFYGSGRYSFANFLDTQLVPAFEYTGTKNKKITNKPSTDFTTPSDDDFDIEQPKKGSDLEQWVESSVGIANKLAASTYLSKDYVFAHADQKVGNSNLTIKDLAQKIIKDIKDVAQDPTFKSAARLVASGTGDKWNPADMFAYEKSSLNSIGNTLNQYESGNIPNASEDMKKANKELNDLGDKVKGKAGRNIQMIEEMHDLYAYNQLIDTYFEEGKVIPISLKKGGKGSVPLKLIKHKQTKGIEDALSLDVNITNITYVPTAEAGKAIVEFDIGGTAGVKLDFRGFEVTSSIENVQAQVQVTGSTASHGKVTLPLYSFIIKESNGMRAIRTQELMKKRIFGGGVLPASSKHLFTPASIFDEYANNKPPRAGTTSNQRFNRRTLIEDTPKWARYIHWLTKGSLPTEQNVDRGTVVRRVRQKLGDPTDSTEEQMPKGKIRGRDTIVFAGSNKSTKKEWERDNAGRLKKMMPKTRYRSSSDGRTGAPKKMQDFVWAAKYIKTVVQSAEAVFVVDIARKVPTEDIKKNILKSAYLYAASRGLKIFTNTDVKEFFSASTYLKVGG
tara:strand:+ start:533 stop:2410 length:1878 start_codon:yes stop_codon:yes gene_type:complete